MQEEKCNSKRGEEKHYIVPSRNKMCCCKEILAGRLQEVRDIEKKPTAMKEEKP
jgi:hypothetical protein